MKMKKLFYFIISLLLFANVAFASWYNPLTWFSKPVGDTISPMPMFYQSGTSILPRVRQLNLILDRGITVGNSTSTATGTIRWSGTAFEGYDGSNWGSLGGGSSDALTSTTTFAGDVTGTSSSMLLSKIQGRTVTTTQNPSIGYILKWDGTYWNYKPDDTGAGGGITSINSQTGSSQTITTSSHTGNIFYIGSSADTHTLYIPTNPIFTGVSTTNATSSNLRVWGTTILNGNTMPTTTCATGEMPVAYSSGVLQCRATSTLGLQSTLTTGNLTAGTGLSFDNTRQVIGGAAQISVATGYNLLTDASSTEFASSSNKVIKTAPQWDSTYTIVNNSSTNWTTAYNTVNSSSTYWDTAYNRVNGTLSDGKYCTYASATGKISCNSTPSTGITSLAGQTGATQTFSTTTGTGLSFKVVSSANNHDFQASIASGYNLLTDASSTEFASSSNKVIKTAPNWDSAYGFAHATMTESIIGIDLTGQALSLTSGYIIPTTASTTDWTSSSVALNTNDSNWTSAYTIVNSSSTYWDTAYNRVNGTLTDGKYCTYASATGKISCNSTPSTGITSLAGQTGATQTISTTTGTGLSFKVVSSANNHDFQASIASGYNLVTDASSTEFASSSNKVIKTAPNWDTAYSVINSSSSNWDIAHNRTTKGTLTATKLCTWNAGGYFDCNTDPSASSGFTTTSINNFATTTFSFATGTATGIGLTITTSTSAVTFTPTVSSGYGIPLTASSTEWANAYNRIYGGTMTDAKYCTYASATGKISCNSEGGAGGGFTTTTFKTAYQNYATTTLNFATTSDTNLGLAVLIDTTGITLTPQWTGTLADARITSANKWNALDTASSSWNNAGNLAHATATESILGIDLTGQDFSLTAGYVIPSTTRATTWDDAYTERVDTWTYPLQLSSNVASIASNYFLTTSTEFGGDVSGTSSAIVVADDSHSHGITTGGSGTTTIKTNGVIFGYSPTRIGQDDRFTYNTSTDLFTFGNGSTTNFTATNIWGTKLIYTNASTTNITASGNGYFGAIPSAGNVSSTNLTTGNLYATAIPSAGNVSSTNLTTGNLYATWISATNGSTTNFTVGTNSYLGTVKSGTWNGTLIGLTYGGTGTSTTPTTDQILVGNSGGTYDYRRLVAGSNITLSTSTAGQIVIASTASGSGGTTVFVTTTPSLIIPTSTISTYDFALGSTATATAPFWWDISATTSYIGTAGAGDGAIDFTHNGIQAMTLGYDYSAGLFRFSTTTDFSAGNALSISTSTLAIGLGGYYGSATECDYGTSTSATTTIDFASTTKPCFSNMARVEIATTTSVLSIVNPPLNGNLDIRIFQGSSVTTTLSFASNIAFEYGFLPSLPYGTSTESLISCKYRTVAGSNSTKNFKCQLSKDFK